MFFRNQKSRDSQSPSRTRSRRFEPLEAREMMTSVYADFNGDGFDDLAIGIPGEDIGNLRDAGEVSVIYGGKQNGLSASGNQLWSQNSPGIKGRSQANDKFGTALVAGDFNGDGYDDLAIGSPGERSGGKASAGAVNIIYGSANRGLQSRNDQVFSQHNSRIVGRAETV